jgi:hypothetical protein
MACCKLMAHWAAMSLLLCGLAACGNPYALSLDDINETPFWRNRDAPAAIEISPPQIYARETLINDRRQEKTYLDKLLEESVTIKFDPQLRRELVDLTSVGLALQGKYDPASVNSYTEKRRLDEIENERAVLEKQLEVRRLEQQVEALDAGAAEGAPAPAGGAAPPGGATPAAAPTAAPAPAAAPAGPAPAAAAPASAAMAGNEAVPTIEVVKGLRPILKDLRDQLDKSTTLPVTALSGLQPDPREVFRDRQAYRSDLRSALSEAQLDDIHDQQGRSLYRMQFRATVLPGKVKDKWGIAELDLKRPIIKYGELKSLYNSWLAHSTYRMNVSRDEGDPGRNNLRVRDFEALGASTGLFEAVRIYYNSDKALKIADPCQQYITPYELDAFKGADFYQSDACDKLTIAVPPDQGRFVHPVLPGLDWLLLAYLAEKVHFDVVAAQGAPLPALDMRASDASPACSLRPEPASSAVSAGSGLPFKDALFKLLAAVTAREPQQSESRSANEVPPQVPPDAAGISTAQQNFARDPTRNDLAKLRDVESKTILRIGEGLQTLSLESLLALTAEPINATDGSALRRAAIRARLFLERAEPILTTINGLVSRRDIDPVIGSKVILASSAYEESVQSARMLLHEIDRASGCNGALLIDVEQHQLRPPGRFCKLITESESHKSCEALDKPDIDVAESSFVLSGNPYVYTAQPLELAQRISTVASAAEALQLGLALQAALPTQGVSGQGAFDLATAALGKVDVLERMPTVVGFARNQERLQGQDEAASEADADRRYMSEFGWVFGPRVRIDPARKKLNLVQQLATYSVTADLSLPSFWPHVRFGGKTAWVGNWHDGSVIDTEDRPERGMRVDLPKNRADYDSLTAYLATRATGRDVQLTRIDRVEPQRPSLCGDGNLTMLVYGANVWRSTELYLQGVPADETSVQVLPDMEGVRASFPLAAVKRASAGDQVKLTAWTRNGFDERTLLLAEDESCQTLGTPRPSITEPAILAVHPSTISACDSTPAIAVETQGLGEIKQVLLGNLLGSTRGNSLNLGLRDAVIVEFSGANARNAGLGQVPLTLVGKDGVASLPILRVGEPKDGCKPVDPTAALKPAIAEVRDVGQAAVNTIDVCRDGPHLLRISGTALAGVAKGKISNRLSAADGATDKAVTVAFDDLKLGAAPGNPPVTLELLDAGDKKVIDKSLNTACAKPEKKEED